MSEYIHIHVGLNARAKPFAKVVVSWYEFDSLSPNCIFQQKFKSFVPAKQW